MAPVEDVVPEWLGSEGAWLSASPDVATISCPRAVLAVNSVRIFKNISTMKYLKKKIQQEEGTVFNKKCGQ